MNHLGHIEIKGNRIVFVYYELANPKRLKELQEILELKVTFPTNTPCYKLAMEKYEASKREVEVVNWQNPDKTGIQINLEVIPLSWVKDGLPCEAEVADGKAIITKIINYGNKEIC